MARDGAGSVPNVIRFHPLKCSHDAFSLVICCDPCTKAMKVKGVFCSVPPPQKKSYSEVGCVNEPLEREEFAYWGSTL